MRKRGFLAVLPAEARLTRQDLAVIEVAPPKGARAPLGPLFVDERTERPTRLCAALDSRVTVLAPVDDTCGNVGDPMPS